MPIDYEKERRKWGFTDKPPANLYFYRLWKQLTEAERKQQRESE